MQLKKFLIWLESSLLVSNPLFSYFFFSSLKSPLYQQKIKHKKQSFHIYDNHMSSYALLRGGIHFNKDYKKQNKVTYIKDSWKSNLWLAIEVADST